MCSREWNIVWNGEWDIVWNIVWNSEWNRKKMVCSEVQDVAHKHVCLCEITMMFTSLASRELTSTEALTHHHQFEHTFSLSQT